MQPLGLGDRQGSGHPGRRGTVGAEPVPWAWSRPRRGGPPTPASLSPLCWGSPFLPIPHLTESGPGNGEMESEGARGPVLEQPLLSEGWRASCRGLPSVPPPILPYPPETPPPGQHQGDPQARPFRICCFRFLPALRPSDPGKPQGQSPCGSLRVSADTHHLHVSGGSPNVLEGRQPPEPAPLRVQLLSLRLQRLHQNLPSEATAGTGCGETELLACPPRSTCCPPAGRDSSPRLGCPPMGDRSPPVPPPAGPALL